VPVTLYWRALEGIDRDYSLALHLLGRDGALVGSLDTWPGGGLAATSQWTPGTILADSYSIPVDDQAAVPTLLRLDVYFWDEDPLVPLPRKSLEGVSLPSVTFQVGRAVPAEAGAVTPEHEAGSLFEHGLRLVGYEAGADGALDLTLYWRLEAEQRVPGDYTVFMHVVDEQGLLIMEPVDGPPIRGNWPTWAWEPGHTLADTRLVALPPDLPAGRYDVRLGFYDPNTGARLTAWKPDGSLWPDDAVVLEGVVVK
jgi:hypothetical protein